MRGYTAKVGLRKPEPVDVPYSWGGEVLDDEPIPHAADGGYVLTPEFAQLVGSPLLSALNEGFNDIERTRRTSAYDAGGLLPVVSQTFNASSETGIDESTIYDRCSDPDCYACTRQSAPFCTRCTSAVCVCGVER